MNVSVVLCTHTMERYPALVEAAESVMRGTYEDYELVCVSDGDEAVYDRLVAEYGARPRVTPTMLDRNRGLLAARNHGAAVAGGDVVAFIDDDAVADERWLERLVDAYETRDPVAVGGKMLPQWVAGRPQFLPEEFYWLIGVSYPGSGPGGDPDAEGEVRNPHGSNMSFRAEVFEALGGFETDIGGRKGDNHLQGGETELCARLRERFDEGVWYVPDATVEHKIYEYRTKPDWLLERAFWQGYSKRGMEQFVPESTGEERDFLGDLFTEHVPRRLKGLVFDPGWEKLLQFVFLLLCTAAVGVGYLYGWLKWG